MPDLEYHTIRYGNIAVSYLPRLDGGGITFGQQYVRVVRERLGHVGHAFEFCAGPGFIGFSLLAQGACDRLTLADVNPDAVRAAQHTVRANGLEDRVSVYLSDCLDDIPDSERWDLVVSNPPHWPGDREDYQRNIRLVDPGWEIHRRFYAQVRQFLNPDASVIIQENGHATRAEEFLPMIEASGLRVHDVFEAEPPSRLSRLLAPVPAVPEALRRAMHRALAPVERALMVPSLEKLLKDNDAYRRLRNARLLNPSPFYFIWSKPARAADAPSATHTRPADA